MPPTSRLGGPHLARLYSEREPLRLKLPQLLVTIDIGDPEGPVIEDEAFRVNGHAGGLPVGG